MENRIKSNVKLGVFVLAGVGLLMSMLYFVGRNQNKWTSGVLVRVHFSQLAGLVEGNNVLYAGMPAGSVKGIRILNDTIIEVRLSIDKKTSPFIHTNAVVSIGSEGLMGNKVINITPVPGNDPLIGNDDLLKGQEDGGLEKLLPRIGVIGDNVSVIAATLRKTLLEVDSGGILQLLKQRQTAGLLLQSLEELHMTTSNAAAASVNARNIVSAISSRNSTIMKLMQDTDIVLNLRGASAEIRTAAETIHRLSDTLDKNLSNRSGIFNLVLTDSASANNFRASLINIRQGTDNFTQDMEALKHNFLLRGYFRKKQKEGQVPGESASH